MKIVSVFIVLMLTCYSACLAAILRVPGDYPSIREALEACILDANRMARFFTVTGQVNVQFSGLMFRNGRVSGSYAIYGGAIWSSAV